MIKISEEYEELKNKTYKYEQDYLLTKIPFGKHKGKTIGKVYREDKQYIYWLARESEFCIKANVLGLPIPDLIDVMNKYVEYLRIDRKNHSYNWKLVEEEFIITYTEWFGEIVDNWNAGHYGCTGTVVREAYSKDYEIKYTISKLLEHASECLCKEWPWIKWDEPFLERLVIDYKNLETLQSTN